MIAGLLTACTEDRAGLGGDAPEWLTARAEPVHLTVTLDAERARGKVITPGGGTVTATGADGTRYSLRVPEGALLSDELITLIPVAGLEGLPLAGDSFATVQLEPSGLQLLEAATLTIRSRREVPPDEQVAFGYSGSGQDAHLTPILPDERGRIEIPVLHFSGYGYGRAAPNDPGRLALQKATSEQGRMLARVAAILKAEAARQRAAGDESMGTAGDEVQQVMVEYYDVVLEPLMKTAERDERMADCAIQRFTVWSRQIQLLGMVGDRVAPDGQAVPGKKTERSPLERRHDAGAESFRRILLNTAKTRTEQAIERCRTDQEFDFMTTVLAIERQLQLIGMSSGEGDGIIPELLEEGARCVSFEVEFSSVIEIKTPTGGTFHHVRATVPWMLADTPQAAPLEYVGFRASGNPTRDLMGDPAAAGGIFGMILQDTEGTLSAVGTKGASARVFAIEWDMNLKDVDGTSCEGTDEKQKRTMADSLRITIAPGVPVEILRLTPLRSGARMQLTEALNDGFRAAGARDGASAVESPRVGGPITSEETYWADTWASFRKDQAVANEAQAGHPGGAFKIHLKPAGKGIWRADFETSEEPVLGFSRSERSSIIVTHKPR